MCLLFHPSRAIIKCGKISHNEKLGVFTVLGTSGKPNVIRLFPTESCSCPSTSRCYHIMAVRMSIGLDTTSCKQKVNLTQLRRNNRSRKDKTSGRKRPRIEDFEVVAAPDSLSSVHSQPQLKQLKSSVTLESPDPSNQPLESLNPCNQSSDPSNQPSSQPMESPNVSKELIEPPNPSNQPVELPNLSNSPIESPDPSHPPIESHDPSHQLKRSLNLEPSISKSVSSHNLQQKPPCDPVSPPYQQADRKCLLTNSDACDGISIPLKVKKRRKKLRFDDQLENDIQPASSEASSNFDKLYGPILLREKLDDGHISAACKILHKQFPNVQGLSTPVLGQNLSFPLVNQNLLLGGYEYIQVLHTGADHWVTICVVSSNVVKVYDSLYHSTTYFTKKQIASILHTKAHQVKLQIGMTQFQDNSLDCGVYAIAFATDLCQGNDPSQLKYDVPNKLRIHLVDSLKAQVMKPFPSVKLDCELGYLTEKMNIYCKCRLLYAPEHGFATKEIPRSEDIHMIQCYTCEEWYHKSCANLSIVKIKELKKDDAKWLCEKCLENFDIFSSDE